MPVLGLGYIHNLLLAESEIVIDAGKDVHDPMVATTVYTPNSPTVTSFEFPLTERGTAFHVQTEVKPVGGLTVAVMIVVIPGNNLVKGEALNVTVGCALTVKIPGADVTAPQTPGPVIAQRYW